MRKRILIQETIDGKRIKYLKSFDYLNDMISWLMVNDFLPIPSEEDLWTGINGDKIAYVARPNRNKRRKGD